jgi:hypothetical protein
MELQIYSKIYSLFANTRHIFYLFIFSVLLENDQILVYDCFLMQIQLRNYCEGQHNIIIFKVTALTKIENRFLII